MPGCTECNAHLEHRRRPSQSMPCVRLRQSSIAPLTYRPQHHQQQTVQPAGMEAASSGSGGLASPPPADDNDMMAVDSLHHSRGGNANEVAPELREQALGLISDAQTAGDRREKEALLKQVGGSWGGVCTHLLCVWLIDHGACMCGCVLCRAACFWGGGSRPTDRSTGSIPAMPN